MYLKHLADLSDGPTSCWRAYAICDEDGQCDLDEEIAQLLADATAARAMRSLLALLENCLAEPEGPQLYIGTLVCHEAVAGAQIYEFIKGPLRLYWFYGADRRVIIIPGIYRKKQQTTPRKIERMLRKAKQDYLAAHGQGTLNY